ncbi:unnamed protein product [Didymodactylos carnosus]|uniref:Uncharacterized protein n=1 Tax=Didymodactylos carnosus TaxID=1234261 RepID=A0A815DE88_9BILA|nr:unnamed protein product [Didymodactylos carnosus]CAF4113077.1 unnamed protein product [Didymodactylos carnosus]
MVVQRRLGFSEHACGSELTHQFSLSRQPNIKLHDTTIMPSPALSTIRLNASDLPTYHGRQREDIDQ